MRCACPACGDFMIHADNDASCVCPSCLRRCSACLGTDSVLSRESVLAMKKAREASQTKVKEELEKKD
ncbi:MAG: hypothetical protein IKT57_07430 [Clostridia bacterium]|nr:hypothetical protein [Clostridia bacterium]